MHEIIRCIDDKIFEGPREQPAARALNLAQHLVRRLPQGAANGLHAGDFLRFCLRRILRCAPATQRTAAVRPALHFLDVRSPHTALHRAALSVAWWVAKHHFQDCAASKDEHDLECALAYLEALRNAGLQRSDRYLRKEAQVVNSMLRMGHTAPAVQLAQVAAEAATQALPQQSELGPWDFVDAQLVHAKALGCAGVQADAINALQGALATLSQRNAVVHNCPNVFADMVAPSKEELLAQPRAAGRLQDVCSYTLQFFEQATHGQRPQAEHHKEAASSCMEMSDLCQALPHRQEQYRSLRTQARETGLGCKQVTLRLAKCATAQYHAGVLHLMLGHRVDALRHLSSCESYLAAALPDGCHRVARARAYLARVQLRQGMQQLAVRKARAALRALGAP